MSRSVINKLALLILFVYISYINVFVARTAFDVLFIQFVIIVYVFWKVRRTEFVAYWLPFVSAFVVYEYLRGISDDLAPFGRETYYLVYRIEDLIFPVLPTSALSPVLNIKIIKAILFLAYTSFFYYSFLIGFIIWLGDKKLFVRYAINFLMMSYTGLLLFFFVPTAPPWYVSMYLQDLGYVRTVLDGEILPRLVGLGIYWHYVGGNEVAAFPSLHVAWVAYSTLFFLRKYKRERIYTFLIALPILVAISVVANAEHWLIDALAGFVLAIVFVKLDIRVFNQSKAVERTSR